MAPHLPDADRPSHATFDGQTWDLPASDAIRLHVMWPLTPAGRQHLAFVEERCRTCCLRASKNSRPLRCYLSWLNPTPHATAVYASCSALLPPHATLASRRPATALPGLDFHQLIAPALAGAFGAVGTRVASRPPHRPVLAAFPHTVPTSGTDNQALRLDVCSPALALALRQPRVPGTESGSWRAGPHSPWPLSFAPPTPPQ